MYVNFFDSLKKFFFAKDSKNLFIVQDFAGISPLCIELGVVEYTWGLLNAIELQ